MSMNTTSNASHHTARIVFFAVLLTLVFGISAWAMTAIGQFSESATVATLVISAFCASWVITGAHRGPSILTLRARTR